MTEPASRRQVPDAAAETTSAAATTAPATHERWLSACRAAVAAQRELFDATPDQRGRTVYEGVGEGGDHSLVIDRIAEQVMLDELAAMHAEGHDFRVVTEERGLIEFGSGGPTVIVDPIDGSLNFRRGLPSHSLSVAVASGPTMADTELGYVYDFGAGREYVAARDEGATVDGRPVESDPPDVGLEVVALESASPERMAPVLEGLRGRTWRIRVVGSLAISLCLVGARNVDGLISARGVRSVDVAAAQLFAREAGTCVWFGGDPAEASIELDARYPLVAGRTLKALDELREVYEDAEVSDG